jgi:predicted nucleic acid-binding protein
VENNRNPKVDRRQKVEELLNHAGTWVPHSKALDQRVFELQKIGFHAFDAYHLAAAEAGGCDRLVTCDDRFLKTARRNAATMLLQWP